jgi:hypothetical protein
MLVLDTFQPETGLPRTGSPLDFRCRCMSDEENRSLSCRGLSNDYLNHYSEALMLIELAASDSESAADLAAWRPLGYRVYFENSLLRRAPTALAAYDALPAERRLAFEALTGAMDKLATTAILALQPPCEPEEAALIAGVTLPAFRRLIDRAARFLNSGGLDAGREGEVDEAQRAIDRLLEKTGA